MTRRSTMTATALALGTALLVAACGRGGGGESGTAESVSPPPEPTASRSAGETGGPGAPGASGAASATPSTSSAGVPDAPAAGGDGPAADTPRDTSRKTGGGRGADATELAVLTGVRVGVHGSYDRVVLDFERGVPAYTAEYVDALHQDGSGEEVPVAGEHQIMIILSRAQPEHPERKFDPGPRAAATPTVREVELVSYFEGDTRFGIGVDARRGGGRPGFRVTVAEGRLVVDIAHEAAAPAG
ncbi:hypothetical protein ACFSJS_03425 [Streptomyces desertarenae]|uniref:AMIN-like domain-containing protein n=2 Tax=Streptomyces desertarenae TaxID=2666184 RepID=A0ABW4PDG0_9ACTN